MDFNFFDQEMTRHEIRKENMDFNFFAQDSRIAGEDVVGQEMSGSDSRVEDVADSTPAGDMQASDADQGEIVAEEPVREAHAGSTALAALVPHCAVMLVLDTSHSMWGRGLQDMKQALAEFYGRMREAQFPGAFLDVAAVSMGENFGMLEDFVPVSESALLKVNIRPKGDTPIGAALSLALSRIHAREQEYRSRGLRVATPQLIVLTDGCNSSDEYAPVASQIRRECEAGALECRAIAMGSAPDLAALRAFAGDKVVVPAFGGLCKSLEAAAEDVSTRYEDEVVRRLAEDGVPEADKVLRADGLAWHGTAQAPLGTRVHDSSRGEAPRQPKSGGSPLGTRVHDSSRGEAPRQPKSGGSPLGTRVHDSSRGEAPRQPKSGGSPLGTRVHDSSRGEAPRQPKSGGSPLGTRVHDSSRGEAPRQPKSGGSPSSEECIYLLDGSNIMHWNTDRGPCLEPVLAITDEFDRQGISYIAIFDASARHVLEKKAGAGAQLQRLYKRKEQFKEAPAGVQADAFLLSVADRRPGSVIVSNDLYRDYQKNYPWLKQAADRRMTGMVINGEVVTVNGGKGRNLHFPMASAEK